MIDAMASTRLSFSDDNARNAGDDPARRRLRGDHHLAVAEALPLVRVAGVAGVAGVHADHEVELLHALPERVELGKRERLAALPRGHRRHTDEEDLGAALGDVLELVDRGVVAGREADDRRGVDGVGVHVGPVLVHPLVQRVDHRAHGVGVVGHPLLEDAGQRRPQEGAVDAHLLHELEPGLGIEEGVEARHRHHLPEAASALVPNPAPPLVTSSPAPPGTATLVEGGVGDVVGDLVPDRQLGAAADVDVPDRRPRTRGGRNLVSASWFSYRWLSASNVVYGSSRCVIWMYSLLVMSAPVSGGFDVVRGRRHRSVSPAIMPDARAAVPLRSRSPRAISTPGVFDSCLACTE